MTTPTLQKQRDSLLETPSPRELPSQETGHALCADDARVAWPLFQAEYGGSKPTSALQLQLRTISLRGAMKLNENWHSRLPKTDFSNIIRSGWYHCFVAESSNVFYAVAIWTNPVARLLNGRGMIELRRLAIAPDAPKNTASRMLRIMALLLFRELGPRTLISYQDTEVHTGGIYKAAGWSPTARNESGEWNRPNRFRKGPQSAAPKQRWELAPSAACSVGVAASNGSEFQEGKKL